MSQSGVCWGTYGTHPASGICLDLLKVSLSSMVLVLLTLSRRIPENSMTANKTLCYFPSYREKENLCKKIKLSAQFGNLDQQTD